MQGKEISVSLGHNPVGKPQAVLCRPVLTMFSGTPQAFLVWLVCWAYMVQC